MGRIPTFSLEERDRRWARVRGFLAREGLDAVIATPNTSHWDAFQADVRYLTQIGGNNTEGGVVFPLDGEVTAIVRSEDDQAWWSVQQDWVTDVRISRHRYSGLIAERLQELRLDRGRIGVVGLEGSVRAPEGTVVWTLFENLRQALPLATFVDATQVMQEARAVKSPDEVEFIRRADRLAEAAVERMQELARPGVSERAVYGAMLETMIAGGGDVSTMILWGAGQQPPWPHRMLTDRVFQAGDLINNEVEAKWAGYIAQIVAPCALGPFDATSRAVFDCSVELFQDLASFMKPGVTFVEIEQRYRSAVEQAGYEGGAILHGRGLGEDRPLMVRNHRVLADPELALEEGMCFILKPAAFPKGTAGLGLHNGEMVEFALRAGDMVVVTPRGAERLGTRPFRLVEL